MVDPISALTKSSDLATAIGVLARFVHWIKQNSITLLCTSLAPIRSCGGSRAGRLDAL